MNLADLEFSNAGNWPAPIKLISVLLIIAAVGGAGYWYDAKEMWEKLETTRKEEKNLKQEFIRKQ